LKEISEKFEQENLWCVLTFDCRKGYEEAKKNLELKKEDFKQAKLILEENQIVEQDKKITKTQNKTKIEQEYRKAREEIAKKELEEIFQKRKNNRDTNAEKYKSREKEESNIEQINRISKQDNDNYSITVWDLQS